MLNRNAVFAMAAAVLLGACSGVQTTRNAPIETLPTQIGMQATTGGNWHVQEVRVNVPETLTVSEANLYVPASDIVWREDPYGDRRAQVKAIVELSMQQAFIGMQGAQAVIVDVELRRFHALSQKSRASVGGVHKIHFDVTVRDAETGRQLLDTFPISASLKAYGGQKAIDAEMRGETQKVRISRHITEVMKQVFSQT
ncbi:MAG: hypothetical protein O3A08_08235 [Proteobacteria bacterium]|nr:hypothetical protein [Pseudomonadota bacterium]MDA1286402.1 hypothetical protein [Pseudomonadota bacterium]